MVELLGELNDPPRIESGVASQRVDCWPNKQLTKLSETNWNLLTRIGFHLAPVTPKQLKSVSHYQMVSALSVGGCMLQNAYLLSTYRTALATWSSCLEWASMRCSWAARIETKTLEGALTTVVYYVLLTMRSERSPQGSRATEASGLSSGGGGWGTQL